MQYPKHAVILAAGLGSRLGLNIPKCLVEIDGKKIIDTQLELLKEIPDIRIVVGFKEEDVMNHVKKIRPDAIFVRNPSYAHTSNCYSTNLAVRYLKDPHIIIDGDVIIGKEKFEKFLKECKNFKGNIIGVTKSKTDEAIFVELDKDNNIIEFKRSPKSENEWCGIAYLYDIKILANESYIYQALEKRLPLKPFDFDCYEIDTPGDLERASSEIKNLN